MHIVKPRLYLRCSAPFKRTPTFFRNTSTTVTCGSVNITSLWYYSNFIESSRWLVVHIKPKNPVDFVSLTSSMLQSTLHAWTLKPLCSRKTTIFLALTICYHLTAQPKFNIFLASVQTYAVVLHLTRNMIIVSIAFSTLFISAIQWLVQVFPRSCLNASLYRRILRSLVVHRPLLIENTFPNLTLVQLLFILPGKYHGVLVGPGWERIPATQITESVQLMQSQTDNMVTCKTFSKTTSKLVKCIVLKYKSFTLFRVSDPHLALIDNLTLWMQPALHHM